MIAVMRNGHPVTIDVTMMSAYVPDEYENVLVFPRRNFHVSFGEMRGIVSLVIGVTEISRHDSLTKIVRHVWRNTWHAFIG